MKGLVAAGVSALLLAGCASVPMGDKARDAELKKFSSPPEGNSALYIYRDSFLGQGLKKTIYVDGSAIGETANNVYFYKVVPPGEHTVSTESEFSDNALKVQTEVDQNYFIRQYIKPGVFVGGAGLELVDEEEGKQGILGTKLAKSWGQ